MKELLRNSDFILKISFVDIFGQGIEVKKFKFIYSTPLSESVEFWFDGESYSANCTSLSDGVEVVFRKPKFNVGQLKVRRQFTISSDHFDDHQREVTQVEFLPVYIVDAYTRNLKCSPKPIIINCTQEDILFVETVTADAFCGADGVNGIDGPKGDKGEKGESGTPAIDYSITQERIVLGEFWVDKNGARKQVYIRTFNNSTSSGHVLAYGATSILSVKGYVIDSSSGNLKGNIFDFLDSYIYFSPNGSGVNELCAMKKTDEHFQYSLNIRYTK